MGINFSWKGHNWWLRFPLIIFIISSFLDLFFTTRNYLFLKYLPELNPVLKILGGNYWAFLTFNILLTTTICLIYLNSFNNKQTSLLNKYTLYSIFLLVSSLRFIGAWSNFSWVLHPVTDPVALQQIQNTVVTQGSQIYFNFVWNWVVYPYIMLYIVFFLFSKAVKLKEA
jgi:hypothetical protein